MLQQEHFVIGGREWHLEVYIDCSIFIVSIGLGIRYNPMTTGYLAPSLLDLVRQQALGFLGRHI